MKQNNTENLPQIFNFNSNPITLIQDDFGDPWFVAKEVCDVLDILNVSQAVGGLDPDEISGVCITDTSSNGVTQRRNVNTISESGLYTLILRSRKPEAREFRRWVTGEVLPSN